MAAVLTPRVDASMASPSRALAAFAAQLSLEDIPQPVLRHAEDLLVDWFGCALSGKGARPVEAIERFARAMGPELEPGRAGAAEVLLSRRATSPLFAAMVNAGASHYAEQDDVHLASVFHPGAVVFPPALAVAQALGASGREFLTAVVAGYEVGIRVGEFLGDAHYKVFHMTGTAGTLAAAAAVGRLLQLTPAQMLDAFGSAGTQAAGLWEFLTDAADSKQLHTAKAAADGLLAAYLAADGFTGAQRILEGTKGMAAGMSRDSDPARLVDGLGTRWALAETSFKVHASCRHTHPAADALLHALQVELLAPQDIAEVVAHVHQGAIDVLSAVSEPRTVHQAKFSMGTVLGLVAVFGRAGVAEFEQHWADPRVAAFRDKVRMVYDREVERTPGTWMGKLAWRLRDGTVKVSTVPQAKGDPGHGLSRAELEAKAIGLAAWSRAASEPEMRAAFDQLWNMRYAQPVPRLFVPS